MVVTANQFHDATILQRPHEKYTLRSTFDTFISLLRKSGELSESIGSPYNPAAILTEAAINKMQADAVDKCSGVFSDASGFDCAQAAYSGYLESEGESFTCNYHENESACGRRYLQEVREFLADGNVDDFLSPSPILFGPPPPSMSGAGDTCAYLGVGGVGCETATGEVPTPGVMPLPSINLTIESGGSGQGSGNNDDDQEPDEEESEPSESNGEQPELEANISDMRAADERQLERAGYDIHEIKDDMQHNSRSDLYIDRNGNIYVARKNGTHGEWTGENINWGPQ